jgi:hypothetical protein
MGILQLSKYYDLDQLKIYFKLISYLFIFYFLSFLFVYLVIIWDLYISINYLIQFNLIKNTYSVKYFNYYFINFIIKTWYIDYILYFKILNRLIHIYTLYKKS